jgi:sodium transport system ATP-binding protein
MNGPSSNVKCESAKVIWPRFHPQIAVFVAARCPQLSQDVARCPSKVPEATLSLSGLVLVFSATYKHHRGCTFYHTRSEAFLGPADDLGMSATLCAQNLVKRFGQFTAAHAINLTVCPGEVVGLLGPNGAGKTTILRMLAGIISPTEGEVSVAGLRMQPGALAPKQRIGFLSGDTQLYQRLTPREVLRYFGRLYLIKPPRLEQRIEELIQELQMSAFADRLCRTLSSGEKQRANIARAFLHEPDLLILDEPTVALDVISGQFIVEAIRRQRAAGRAILFSTHIMSEAEYLCDRIYLLHHGRIIDHGSLREILDRSGCANLTDAFFHYIGARQAPPIPGTTPAA